MTALGILLMMGLTLYSWIAYERLDRKLVAAQAEVERLKALPVPVAVAPSGACPKGSQMQTTPDGKLFACLAGKPWATKPQPKRAPTKHSSDKFHVFWYWDGTPARSLLVAPGECSSNMTFEQCKAAIDGRTDPAIDLPLEPETGPMFLQNSNGQWHPWRKVEVRRSGQ